MRRLEHCNIVKLMYFFYTSGEKKDEIYLNLVLEFIPETVYKVARQYAKSKQSIPGTFIRLYMYNCSEAWHTSILKGFVIATSSLRTCSWIQSQAFSSYAILEAPSTWCEASPMSLTFAPETTELLSSFSEPL